MRIPQRPPPERIAQSFNSLFEMQETEEKAYEPPRACFNSLFEMHEELLQRYPQLRWWRSFNSLFEMLCRILSTAKTRYYVVSFNISV